MKILFFGFALILVANASLEGEFSSLEKAIQDKLVSKVLKAVGSLKSLVDNIHEIEKVFPSDYKQVKGELTSFVDNLEKLVDEAKDLYEDKKKDKLISLTEELIDAASTFDKVETEIKSVRPMLQKMIGDHVESAKSALSELEDFFKSLIHVAARSVSSDFEDVEKLISGHVFEKIQNAYKELKSGLAKIKLLSKQVPEVYSSMKTEIPKLEKTLKSLLADATAAAKDKKKGDTILTIVKVGEAGVKLAELTDIINKVKPELSGILKEVTGPSKKAVKEVEDLLKLIKHV